MALPSSAGWQNAAAWALFGGALLAVVAYDRLASPTAQQPAAAVPPVVSTDVAERKQRFFAFLTPKIEAENARIRAQRQRLQDLRARLKQGRNLTARQKSWLRDLASRYRVSLPDEELRAPALRPLLQKVDTVPEPLILAQAAIESNWGRSRFARQGNNLFGLWCFEKGCGLVPLRREAGKSHEVESFASVQAGVRKYLLNLNRHPRYSELRELRAAARRANTAPSALELAAGLDGYSQRGQAYVHDVRQLIRSNDLG
jgi:Bax protein